MFRVQHFNFVAMPAEIPRYNDPSSGGVMEVSFTYTDDSGRVQRRQFRQTRKPMLPWETELDWFITAFRDALSRIPKE